VRRRSIPQGDRAGLARIPLVLTNTRFIEGSLDAVQGRFDLVFAIFFLHHLPDPLPGKPCRRRSRRGWRPAANSMRLDPNRYRLSGAIGSIVVPHLMRRYQTADERELDPNRTVALFPGRRLRWPRAGYYDFLSSPLAGLFPRDGRAGYNAARK